jgi:hypothetical protein
MRRAKSMTMLVEVVLLHFVHRLSNLPTLLFFIRLYCLHTRRVLVQVLIMWRGSGNC